MDRQSIYKPTPLLSSHEGGVTDIMRNYCVCGRELTCTSATPWAWCTMDCTGKILCGTCIHGVYFPPPVKQVHKEYVEHMKEEK